VLETLDRLAKDGIDRATVEASLNTFEFRLRERNTGSFPRGLALMLDALNYWLHGRDPLAPLAFEAPLARVKARVASGERYFEDLIERHLIANPHRTTAIVTPDGAQAQREAEEEEARLAAARARMSAAEVEAVVEDTQALKAAQEAADTPEALATIPSLTLADLPRRNKTIPRLETQCAGTRVLVHEQPTNGIVYLDLAFDLHALPADLLPYVALFGRALLETGAGQQDFVQLSQRIGRYTGGMTARPWTATMADSPTAAARLFLRTKVMPAHADELMAILADVLLRARLDNRERLHQLVLEEKSGLESSLPHMGNRYAAARLKARLSEAAWASEQIGGISYLMFLRDLENAGDWSGVEAALKRVRDLLVRRGAMVLNVTAEADDWRRFEPKLAAFLGQLSDAGSAPADWPRSSGPRSEGLTIPAKVNFVAKGGDLRAAGGLPNGAAAVIQNYLNTTWLWNKVRVQGGAYGGSCSLDRHAGLFTFTSYRDPNLLATLDIYDRTGAFLRETEVSEAELTKSIIGVIGQIDDYQLPDAKGFTSTQRWLLHESEQSLQRFREEVLATRPEDFRAFGQALSALAANADVVVMGSPEAIAAANAKRQGFLAVTKVV
jgi:Zn-dependent M16 (insulinase) family peptidase